MKTKKHLVSVLLLVPALAISQTDVRLVNTGAMHVAAGGTDGVSLYVPDAIQVTGSSAINQQGTTALGGNFYQDSDTHAFQVNEQGVNEGSGSIKLVDNATPNTGGKREITTKTNAVDNFSRTSGYVAFPHVEIATNDEVLVPAKMGIDATTLLRTGSKTGKLYLQSKIYGDKVVDASLRITDATAGKTSANRVSAGAVTIERNVELYRAGSGRSTQFAFASPYESMLSGYFAGNYMRKMTEGANEHVQYVLADKADAKDATLISADQYMRTSTDPFLKGKAYIIELNPSDFDYAGWFKGGGLSETASDYAVSNYVFNGTPKAMIPLRAEVEQFFADTISRKLSSKNTATVNWIIGNSNSSAISIAKLKEAMEASGIAFSNTIYLFNPGSGYQPLTVNNYYDAIQVTDGGIIPAMSFFMVRVSKTNTVASGRLDITPDMLVHNDLGHNLRSNGHHNEVLFRVSLANKPTIYDLAAVGMREGASENADEMDMSKITGAGADFYMYFTSPSGSRYASSALPFGTQSANLAFYPGKTKDNFTLEASRLESLQDENIEGLWLEDTQTGTITDLFASNGQYSFSSEAGDNVNRFVVHFRSSEGDEEGTTDSKTAQGSNITMYYANNVLYINNLEEGDLSSSVEIFDMQGRKVRQGKITQAPNMQLPLQLTTGTYTAKVSGERTVSIKFNK